MPTRIDKRIVQIGELATQGASHDRGKVEVNLSIEKNPCALSTLVKAKKLMMIRQPIDAFIQHLSCNLNSVKNSLVGGFFFQAEDGIRDLTVTGVQTCALPI